MARASVTLAFCKLRLELRDRRLLCLDVGLKRCLLEPVEHVALFHLRAFGEERAVDEGGDARDEIDAVGRLDAADEFARLGEPAERAPSTTPTAGGLRGRCCAPARRRSSSTAAKMAIKRERPSRFYPFHARPMWYRNGTVSFQYTGFAKRGKIR